MAPADPPVPPEKPASPPPPAEPPVTMEGPDQGVAGAKPSAPGPVEPPGIAESILPQREQDADRAKDSPDAGKGR